MDLLPSLSSLSIKAKPRVDQGRLPYIGGARRPDVGRIHIGYCGTNCGDFHVFSVGGDRVPLCRLDIGVGGEDQPETADTAVRKAGRKKLDSNPPSLIDPGDFDPLTQTYEVLRADLREQISLLTAIVRVTESGTGGDDDDEKEEEELVDEESVQEAMSNIAETATSVQQTVEELLLSVAYHTYAYNGAYRDEVKGEGATDGDVEEELFLRWDQGRVGRSKAKTRIKAKKLEVDRANIGRSMGNM